MPHILPQTRCAGKRPDVDLEKLLIALGSFLGGLVTGLLKVIMPSYRDLLEENRQLRGEALEKIDGLLDIAKDNRESEDEEP